MFGPGDGCTLWLDGWGEISWRHCCDVHDIAYEVGAPKFEADLALAHCVASAGAAPMGLVMLFGLSVLGWLFYRRRR